MGLYEYLERAKRESVWQVKDKVLSRRVLVAGIVESCPDVDVMRLEIALDEAAFRARSEYLGDVIDDAYELYKSDTDFITPAKHQTQTELNAKAREVHKKLYATQRNSPTNQVRR